MGADQVDCDSCEYPRTAEQDPQWKDDDRYYSNQMQTGTCVRHALAKALADGHDFISGFYRKKPL